MSRYIKVEDMRAIFCQSNSLTQAWNGFDMLPSIDIDTPEVCYMCRFNIVHFCAMTEADKSSERDRGMRHRQFDDDDDVYKGIPKWCPLKGERKESE